MFNKKRNLSKYRFNYSQSPITSRTNQRIPRILPKKEHPLIRKIKRIFTLVFITAMIILSVYALFFSGYFKIADIVISNQTFSNETLAEKVKESIKNSLGKNIIFIETDDLSSKIISFFPELEKVNVKRNFPNTLTIEFSEYPLAANIINLSSGIKKSYIINSIGYVIKEDFENPALPYIKIQSDEPINIDNPLIGANTLKYILDTTTYFEDKFGMKIKEVNYKSIAREIHLLTEKDFYIWLDIQQPAEEQLKKLKKTLIKLDIYTENLEYIDLRIAGNNGDKIIYKRK